MRESLLVFRKLHSHVCLVMPSITFALTYCVSLASDDATNVDLRRFFITVLVSLASLGQATVQVWGSSISVHKEHHFRVILVYC